MDQLNNYFDNILKTDNVKHITKWVKGQISGLRLFLATESPSKKKKCVLFYLKSTFRS